jgi:elongation factor G
VWSGEAPASGLWTHGASGAPARVRKLYQLRGPRRATAAQLGPGALVATWDPLPGTLGDAYTTGEPLILRAPEAPPPMVAWWVGPVGADGKPAPPRSPEARRFPEVVAALGILDPSVWVDPAVVQDGRVIHGASEAQLAWFVERAAEWFGSVWATGPAPVPYREMPAQAVNAVVGLHKIEDADGLVTAFGEVHIDVEPAEERVGGATDVVVENYLTGDEIPPKFHAAVLAGVREGAITGPRGRPVAGAVFRVVGGEYDILESTDAQLQAAGRLAAQAALARAGTRLLEPWVEVVVWVSPDAAGETLAELSSRRGRILGLEVAGADAAIHAVVPYRELRSFGPRLQSLTGGRGRFLADAWRWEPLPAHLEPERDDRRA